MGWCGLGRGLTRFEMHNEMKETVQYLVIIQSNYLLFNYRNKNAHQNSTAAIIHKRSA